MVMVGDVKLWFCLVHTFIFLLPTDHAGLYSINLCTLVVNVVSLGFTYH